MVSGSTQDPFGAFDAGGVLPEELHDSIPIQLVRQMCGYARVDMGECVQPRESKASVTE